MIQKKNWNIEETTDAAVIRPVDEEFIDLRTSDATRGKKHVSAAIMAKTLIEVLVLVVFISSSPEGVKITEGPIKPFMKYICLCCHYNTHGFS